MAQLTWAPIPLSHGMRGILGLFLYPEWHQGNLFRLTTGPMRGGHLWMGPKLTVLRWRGRNYRLAPAADPWPAIDRIIKNAG